MDFSCYVIENRLINEFVIYYDFDLEVSLNTSSYRFAHASMEKLSAKYFFRYSLSKEDDFSYASTMHA